MVDAALDESADRRTVEHHSVCGRTHLATGFLYAGYYFKELLVQQRFAPSLQMDHLRLGQNGQQPLEGIERKIPVFPVRTVDGSEAVRAGSVTPRGEFKLYPVKPRHSFERPPFGKMID